MLGLKGMSRRLARFVQWGCDGVMEAWCVCRCPHWIFSHPTVMSQQQMLEDKLEIEQKLLKETEVNAKAMSCGMWQHVVHAGGCN